MAFENKTISFIGAGKMAEAIISGILDAKLMPAEKILIADIDHKRLSYLSRKYKVKVALNNLSAVDNSDIVFLSVKPQSFSEVINSIVGSDLSQKGIVSIAAGISLKYLHKKLKTKNIIRIMPNNPCLVKEGMTAISFSKGVDKNLVEFIKKIFSLLGKVIVINEKFMDSITGLSGSGPAFVYSAIEGMINAGKRMGFSDTQARLLTLQTFMGSVVTLQKTGKTPQELIKMVASPKGTTLEGLKILNKKNFSLTMEEAVLAAAKRAKQISKEIEQS